VISFATTGELMPRKSLLEEAEALRQTMSLAPPREDGAPLRWQERARIVELSEQGRTQEQIAAELDCHQSTISRTLADLDDSRPFAQRLLRSRAIELVEQIRERMKTASLAELTKLAGKLDIVRDDRDTAINSGIVINIGAPGSPIRLPDIDIEPQKTA
jgi:Homeodomain-like domain